MQATSAGLDSEAPLRAAPDPPRSTADQQVWRTIVGRLAEVVAASPCHHPAYRTAFAQILARWRDAVPTLQEINAWLQPSGWRALFVDGYVPVGPYQRLQSKRVFPIARSLRPLHNLDHSPSPDFVHDVLGHLPMLFDPDYSDLVHEWAVRGLRAPPTAADNAAAAAAAQLEAACERRPRRLREIDERTTALRVAQAAVLAAGSRHFLFETFYTWAIEFGCLRSAPGAPPTLVGAAILSSPGEITRVLAGEVTFEPFAAAVGRPVDYTRLQQRMFLADDLGQYRAALRAI